MSPHAAPRCTRRLPPAILALLAASLLLGAVGHAQAPASGGNGERWSGFPAGAAPVGYRATLLADSSRTLLPDTAGTRSPQPRLLPLRVWYPATAGNQRAARRVTFADVIGVDARGPNSGLATRTHGLHRYAAQKYDRAGGVPLVAADTAGIATQALASPTAARLGAPVRPGRHPLVLFAGGTAHGIDENVALWEELAAAGYVVAVIPTVAIHADAEEAYLPADAPGLEVVTRDLQLVLAHMLSRREVDAARVAAAGFSFGGAAALILAARDARVRAVVGLDPSFIAGRHLATIRANPLFDARRLTVPVLDFHRADSATVDLSLVRAIPRDGGISVEIAGLDHVDFNSYVLLYAPLLQRRSARPGRDGALDVKAETYRAMVRTSRAFLDAALDADAGTVVEGAVARRIDGADWARVPRETVRRVQSGS
jgi:dienelactone hydrolase